MTDKQPSGILIVDHSRGTLVFQETILRRRGEAVLTAVTGAEGILRAEELRPRLIIFPFDLFDMNAPEFCRAIRENESTRGSSLLLVAERDREQEAELTLSAGCNDVIFKPVARIELDEKVQKLTAIPVRRQLRTITRIEVTVEDNGRFILARTLNISSNGLLLEVDRVLPDDSPVRIQFFLPGDPKPVQVDARLVRAAFSNDGSQYGVRFLRVSDDERHRIDRYVSRLRSRELL